MFIKCLTVGPIQTNCYLVCDKVSNRAAIIDPGAEASRITSALEDTGCTADYVILTHGHADHMSAAQEVLQNTGAKLVVFADEVTLLNDPEMNMFAKMNKQKFQPLKPEIFLHDCDMLTFGLINLKILHTPGHTAGSCCLISQDTIFSGDTLFRQSAGRTDLPTGSSEMLLKSLKLLFALEGDFKLLPGHGEFSTLEYERKNNPFFRSSTNETFS